MPATPQFIEVPLTKWEEIAAVAKHGSGYIYRGQSDAAWPLVTSLERAYARSGSTVQMLEVGERWALHEFRSKYHLYAANPPAPDNSFEWLSILQHHGCPTRLLDFSHSIYVAAHFALTGGSASPAIWCLSQWKLRDNLRVARSLPYNKGSDLKDKVDAAHIDLLNQHLTKAIDNALPHLVPLESSKLTARIARQQGCFVAPLTFGKLGKRLSFSDNLFASFPTSTGETESFVAADIHSFLGVEWPANTLACVKLILGPSLVREAHHQLESMGITEESLFPDLDGLARSLVRRHLR